MITNQIPAGILDKGAELFGSKGKAYAMHGGKRISYRQLPEGKRFILRMMMLADSRLNNAVEAMVGTCMDAKEEKFAMCQFGRLDGTPDINDQNIVSAPEYVTCSNRGNCPAEGIACANILVQDGIFLTRAETDVFKLVQLPDKLIADVLHISIHTVKVHFKNIRIKSGLLNKIEMAIWATQRGILQCI